MDRAGTLLLAYLERHPAAAALVLDRYPPADVAAVLVGARPAVAARVLAHMAPQNASRALTGLPGETAAEVLEAASVDIATTLLRRMPPSAAGPLLSRLSNERAQAIRRLLTFADGTIGALADPLAPALPETATAAVALEWFRSHPEQAADEVFVIDHEHRLVGVVAVHALIVAPATTRLQDLAGPVALRLPAALGAHAAVANPAWTERLSVPVVDASGVFVGVVRYSALRRSVESGTASTEAVGTLVGLGELYWSACTQMVAELGDVLAGAVTGERDDSRDAAG